MSAAAEIAKRLGGRPGSNGQWHAPCPLPSHGRGSGDRRPSLTIADGDTQLLVFCHAGCEASDLLRLFRDKGWLEERERTPTAPRPSLRRAPEHKPDPEAVRLWREAVTQGEVVEKYLAGRCIHAIPPTIRQTIALQFGRIPVPAMLAAVQSPAGEIIAVQETRLTWKAAKAPATVPRITTGALGHGAVRLGPAGETLGLAEGVETALSAMELSGVPCWATLGARRLGSIAIPRGVRLLTIFADGDEPGQAAAEAARKVYAGQGLAVTIKRPPAGFGDWNDVARDLAQGKAA